MEGCNPSISAQPNRQGRGAATDGEAVRNPSSPEVQGCRDRFYGRVGALYGLSRGEKRGDGEPVKRHKSVAEYKAENLRIQAELDEKTKQLESVTAELAVVKDVLKTAFDSVY